MKSFIDLFTNVTSNKDLEVKVILKIYWPVNGL